MKRDEKSSPFLQYVTFSAIFQQFFIMHKWQTDIFQLVTKNADLHNLMDVLISVACLLVCLYWPEKFCVQGLVLSARMYVMVFQDKHTLPKWNILSLLCTSKQLDRIFHFVRVCLSWKTITYIRAERTRPWTQNCSGQYRYTERGVHIIRLWGKTMFWSSLLQNLGCFWQPFHRTYWVTGSDKLLRGNQIDWVIKLVSWFQVFCKEIKSNAVSKLFILVWSYEGMKVLDLGYEKRWKKFSIITICHIFSNFSAVFRNAQVTNRQILKHRFTQLRRTAHL